MQNVNETKSLISEPVSVGDKVAFLRHPSSYPDYCVEVVTKETHMSWVFLAGAYVYKLKKPVAYDLFDHRTLQSREKNSLEELRLNQAMAKGIYLDLVALSIEDNGSLHLGKGERVVDWLVKMKRIPEECMLDYLVLNRCVDRRRLETAAIMLTDFYLQTEALPMTLSDLIDRMQSEVQSNHERLSNAAFHMNGNVLALLRNCQTSFLSTHHSLFSERVEGNRIVEAHGDLRPEHICLCSDPVIIDRLEFSRALRIMDVAEELAFLSLECEVLGGKEVGDLILRTYELRTRDFIPLELTNFYKVKRACTRAYLVARHVQEALYQKEPKWLDKASAYLEIAQRYQERLS